MTFRPQLAPPESPSDTPDYFERLQYPLLVSPKLDGIRNVIKERRCKSRKFIDLPSVQAQEMFGLYEDLDGEIVEGIETDINVFNRTQSYVMSFDKFSDDLNYRIFDYCNIDYAHLPFYQRLEYAANYVKNIDDPHVSMIEHLPCDNYEELIECEERYLALGYEGVMMRNPLGRYKGADGRANRGTFKEGLIYKLKRFQDDEGIVVGFIEKLHNTNPDIKDAFGNAKRSTAKDGMVPAGTVGKFLVDFEGEPIEVATGAFKHSELQEIWDNQDKYLLGILKFRHFPHGKKDKPRFPRAVGWRSLIDM